MLVEELRAVEEPLTMVTNYRTGSCPDDQELVEIKLALNKIYAEQGYMIPQG